ncbi:MAG: hypothetical protein ACI9GM_001408 [Salibacteraceae bacterium]|jgi:hypothetical protein
MQKTLFLFIFLLAIWSSFIGVSQTTHSIAVYPNPVADTLTVNYHIATFGRLDLDLFNIFGQKLWSPLNDSMHWPGHYEIKYDVSPLQDGVYFLTLLTHIGETTTTRFVKQTPLSLDHIERSILSIYPNPARNKIHLPENTTILKVFDLNGKLVLKQLNPSSTTDVSQFKNGLYVIELIGSSRTKTILQIQR